MSHHQYVKLPVSDDNKGFTIVVFCLLMMTPTIYQYVSKQYNHSPNMIELLPSKKQKFYWIVKTAKSAGALQPEVVASQWALESGWGKYESGKNNFFGIKANFYQKGTYVWTKEQLADGTIIKTKAKFRDFATVADGLQAHIDLVQSSPYWSEKYNTAQTPKEAVIALKAGKQWGYATDKNYNNKLYALMQSMGVDINQKEVG